MESVITCRRVQETNILNEMKRQTAAGALYQLIFNALKQPQKHRRSAVMKLCQQQGYTSSEARTAFFVMEMADWVHTQAEEIEVLVFLTEHAKLTGGAEL